MIPPVTVLQLTALVALLVVAAAQDLRHRRIPNTVTVSGLLAGLVLGAWATGGWPGTAMAGAGIALLVSFPLFALGIIGAGDAKLFTAVGAFLGPFGLLPAAVYAGLAGGLLAIGNAVRRKTILPTLLTTRDLLAYATTLGRRGTLPSSDASRSAGIPYGVAIAFGALTAWFFPYFPGGTP